MPLADVKAAGKSNGATVNDVIMAAVTNGFRQVIIAGGGDPAHRVVRAVMPVSMRSGGDTRSNNQVSLIPVELPVGVEGHRQRLAEVVRQTREGKRSMVPELISAVQRAVGVLTPAPLEEAVVAHTGWTFGWMADTLVTNVRGPEMPQYFLGQEVRYLSPIIPIGSTLRTVVGINSYNGAVNVAVTGDADHAGDNRILIDGIRDEVSALLERV
jgi:diacylglycerol O-acyltransferase